jgi:hypothetical protein
VLSNRRREDTFAEVKRPYGPSFIECEKMHVGKTGVKKLGKQANVEL